MSGTNTDRKTILVVDDTDTNRRLLEAVLQGAGYETITAEDGGEALQLLGKRKVDAVVSDILMPVLDGFRLCHEIKKSPKLKHIPVLLQSSAYLSSEDLAFAENIGADAFLRRPYDLDTVIKAVHSMLAASVAKPAGMSEEVVEQRHEERMSAALARTHEELVQVSSEASSLQSLVEHLPVAYISSNAQSIIQDWNPGAEKIFGLSKAEAVGKSLEDLLFHEPGGRIVESRPESQLAEHVGKEGETILCEWFHTVITSPGGEVQGMHSVAMDVTVRNASEAATKSQLEQIRNLTTRLVDAQEQERRHLAFELHDEIGQMLLGLKMALDLSMRSSGYLEEATKITQDLIQRVRDMSMDLRPPMLDDLGLLPALSWLCERSGRVGIPLEFHHKGLKGLDLENRTRTAAYRIVQEAITNCARYSEASKVDVNVWASGHVLHAQIQDDGVGFNVLQIWQQHNSSGLAGMLERATAAQGTLCVESAPGEGTIVMATLPINV